MNNLNGILLVIASMAAFTIEDIFIKRLSTEVATGQILVVIGVFCGLTFFAMMLWSRNSLFRVEAWSVASVARIISEAFAAFCFVTALSRVDISTVAAVFQATPLAITMGAALFMGEKVGWRRWSAIFVGLAGVIIIIRPGASGFDQQVLWVVAAVLLIAVRDLTTRRISSKVASTVISCQAYAGLMIAGVLMLLFMPGQEISAIAPHHIWAYAAAVVFGVAGYYGIVSAMRVADASAVTPFRYMRLPFSILAGMLVFQERPDLITYLGAALIILSGLYTFLRERRLAHEEIAAAG